MEKIYRHGDLGLKVISKLPEDLKETKTKILMKGSHGNNHIFEGGHFYHKKESDFILGYFVAENTTLLHKDHGEKVKGQTIKKAKFPDGIYQVLKQNESRNGELRSVID